MKHRRILIDTKDHPELFAVWTAAETARRTGKHRKTIENAINNGRVAALLVGGVWLVSKASAVALWGMIDNQA